MVSVSGQGCRRLATAALKAHDLANSTNQRSGRTYWLTDRPENTNLVEDVENMLLIKFRKIPLSSVAEENSKIFQQIRCQGRHET